MELLFLYDDADDDDDDNDDDGCVCVIIAFLRLNTLANTKMIIILLLNSEIEFKKKNYINRRELMVVN